MRTAVKDAADEEWKCRGRKMEADFITDACGVTPDVRVGKTERRIQTVFLPAARGQLGGVAICEAPSWWQRRDARWGDAGCMLIRLNANWTDGKEKKKSSWLQGAD